VCNANPDAHADTDAYAHGPTASDHAIAHTYADTHADAHPNAQPNTHSHANAYSDAHTHTIAHTQTYAIADAVAHAQPNPHAYPRCRPWGERTADTSSQWRRPDGGSTGGERGSLANSGGSPRERRTASQRPRGEHQVAEAIELSALFSILAPHLKWSH